MVYLQSYTVPHGTYTEMPVIKSYLLDQQDKGVSVFTVGDEGKISFSFIGCVLRKK